MGIQNFFQVLLVCAIVASGARAEDESAENIVPLDPVLEGHYQETFKRISMRLGVPYAPQFLNVDQLHVLVLDISDATIAITLSRDTSDDKYHFLNVVVRDHSRVERRKIGEVRETTETIKSYNTDITTAEVEKISNSLTRSGFYKKEFVDELSSMCLEGAYYYIEARFNDSSNFVGGHDCDKGFPLNNDAVDELFVLARSHFPMIADRLLKTQSVLHEQGVK